MNRHTKAEAERKLRAARKDLADAQAVLERYDTARHKLDRQRARWHQPALWKRANGKVELIDLASLGVERSYTPSDELKGEARRAGIIRGDVKLRTGLSGASGQRASAIYNRLRIMPPDQARKLAALDRTIARARAAREALLGETTWSNGIKLAPPDAADLAMSQDAVLARLAGKVDPSVYGRYGLESKVEAAVRKLDDACTHAAAVESAVAGEPWACNCTDCRLERQIAEREERSRSDQQARIDAVLAMPRLPYVCRSEVDTPDWRRREYAAMGVKLCADRKVSGGYEATKDGVFCPRCGLGIRSADALERGAITARALARARKAAGYTKAA